MDRIYFYEGKYYFLSNFSSFRVHYAGVDYMTAEHAYQTAKFTVNEHAIVIRVMNARSAHDAKRIARENAMYVREDWHRAKLSIMERIIREKLAQHQYIKDRLIASENAELIEDSPTDSFWGRGPVHCGQNHLGKIWMRLRDEERTKSLMIESLLDADALL